MSGTNAKPAKWSEEQKREFEAITARSIPRGKKLTDKDFDKEGNPVGEWAKILTELDAWAAKYKVKFKTTEQASGGAAAGEGVTPRSRSCPGTVTETGRMGEHHAVVTTCHLRRRRLIGGCVYDCVVITITV
jgi:hypothetical protein